MPIQSPTEQILTKPSLDKIKHFILKRGETCTYSNMFNNNPCIATEHFIFYLNPDPGGPHNTIQWNINCDPKIGDFNTLVIRRILKDGHTNEEFADQYRTIRFKTANDIKLEPHYANPKTPKTKIRTLPNQAIKELRSVMEQPEKHPSPIK